MTVWTYGCSLTSGYNELRLSNKTWPHFLDIGSKYNVVNRADVAKPFHHARQQLLNDIGHIKDNDLVIFQLTFAHRVFNPYFIEDYDLSLKIKTWHLPKGDKAWLPYLKDDTGLESTLKQEALILFNLMKRLKIKFMWWSGGLKNDNSLEEFLNNKLELENFNCYMDWIDKNSKVCYERGDFHVNEDGHRVMAKSFSKQIRNYMSIDPTLSNLKII